MVLPDEVEEVAEGMQKKSKSSTHFTMKMQARMKAQISMNASAGVPWMPPEVAKPNGATWSGKMKPHQETGR